MSTHGHQSCEEILVAILLYTDNEIVDSSERVSLEAHCEQCPSCQANLHAHQESVRLIKQLLGGACREEAPASLHERLIAQIEWQAAQMQAQESTFGPFAGFTQSFSQSFTQTIMQRSISPDGEITIEISQTEEFREGF